LPVNAKKGGGGKIQHIDDRKKGEEKKKKRRLTQEKDRSGRANLLSGREGKDESTRSRWGGKKGPPSRRKKEGQNIYEETWQNSGKKRGALPYRGGRGEGTSGAKKVRKNKRGVKKELIIERTKTTEIGKGKKKREKGKKHFEGIYQKGGGCRLLPPKKGREKKKGLLRSSTVPDGTWGGGTPDYRKKKRREDAHEKRIRPQFDKGGRKGKEPWTFGGEGKKETCPNSPWKKGGSLFRPEGAKVTFTCLKIKKAQGGKKKGRPYV